VDWDLPWIVITVSERTGHPPVIQIHRQDRQVTRYVWACVGGFGRKRDWSGLEEVAVDGCGCVRVDGIVHVGGGEKVCECEWMCGSG
jgi:hypothetical protein